MFAAFPLLALPVLIYNLIVVTLAGGFNATAAQYRLAEPPSEVGREIAAPRSPRLRGWNRGPRNKSEDDGGARAGPQASSTPCGLRRRVCSHITPSRSDTEALSRPKLVYFDTPVSRWRWLTGWKSTR